MTKSPKLYFLDAGLAAWLSGWRRVPEARLGPMGGALFETHILAEILKRFLHRARQVRIHMRTGDGVRVSHTPAGGAGDEEGRPRGTNGQARSTSNAAMLRSSSLNSTPIRWIGSPR